MLGKKRKLLSDSKNDKFLLKLYEILNKEEYNKIIQWSQNGSFIIISNVQALTKNILPIYFNHQNYSSFVRQLNMYNFHKIRTKPNINEQYFIHESFNKNKTLKEIKSFKRKTKEDGKKNIKCLFFQGEDSKIKYTILEKKKEEKNNLYDSIDLIENDEKKIEKFENIIRDGNLNISIQKKMLLFLLNKSKENLNNQKECKTKLKDLSEQKLNCNSQIKKLNNEIESQSMFLKKIKKLNIFLVTLLMRNNNNQMLENKVNKINKGNNDINISKNKGGKNKLVDFFHRYIDYHEKKRIGILSLINNKLISNKINNNKKNIINNNHKNDSLSNIVQKGEAFSINQGNFNFGDYLNKIELLSFKSFKSNKLNDSFSFSDEEKNFNSSFSVIGNNNNSLFNVNFGNGNFNVNQSLLSDSNLITNNNYNNINSSFFNI